MTKHNHPNIWWVFLNGVGAFIFTWINVEFALAHLMRGAGTGSGVMIAQLVGATICVVWALYVNSTARAIVRES